MKVFLLRDVPKVGKKGSIAEVQQGYAHNFLIKNGFARQATKKDEDSIAKQTAFEAAMRTQGEKAKYEMVKALDGKQITISAKANEKDVLFAKLHKADVVAKINEAMKTHVEAQWVHLEQEIIDHLGVYEIKLSYEGAKATVQCAVIKE